MSANHLKGLDISLFCGIGSGTPPEGTTANLIDPPTLGPAAWGITISMTVWALLFTLARVYVNFRKLKASDLNKWARHIWDIPVCWMTGEFMKRLFFQAMMYGPTIYFAKSSLLLLYLQFFAVQRPMRIATWVGLVVVGICYWSGDIIEAPFLAPQPGQTWQDVAFSGRSEKISPWGLVQGPLNVLIDIYTFVLPFPILAKLKLSPRRRLELLIIFSTAFLGVVVSVVALVYRVKLVYTKDVTWAQTSVFLCIVLENNISIVVSCMPAFAVFIKQNVSETNFFRSLRSALMPSSRSRGGGEKSSGPGSGPGSAGAAAQAQKKWPGVSFPRQSDRQKLRHKTDTEEIGFDSYIELHDSNASRSDEGTAALKPPHLSAPRLAPVQLAAQQQQQQQQQVPAYHVPEQGIIRTTEVTQQYYPVSEQGRGQAF
ncbi:hypothetical protein SLS64_008920 [Diaporthe eres]|uniref:Rhodopsin domain-containing protein n=1 Tax=Diaporthe eres TaxID=83184 RepID=A0ABR1NNH0_DIAER